MCCKIAWELKITTLKFNEGQLNQKTIYFHEGKENIIQDFQIKMKKNQSKTYNNDSYSKASSFNDSFKGYNTKNKKTLKENFSNHPITRNLPSSSFHDSNHLGISMDTGHFSNICKPRQMGRTVESSSGDMHGCGDILINESPNKRGFTQATFSSGIKDNKAKSVEQVYSHQRHDNSHKLQELGARCHESNATTGHDTAYPNIDEEKLFKGSGSSEHCDRNNDRLKMKEKSTNLEEDGDKLFADEVCLDEPLHKRKSRLSTSSFISNIENNYWGENKKDQNLHLRKEEKLSRGSGGMNKETMEDYLCEDTCATEKKFNTNEPSVKNNDKNAEVKEDKASSYIPKNTNKNDDGVNDAKLPRRVAGSRRNKPKKSRASKESKRIPRPTQSHEHCVSRDVNASMARFEEKFLVFLGLVKSGVLSALSNFPHYFSVAWSMMSYILRLIIVLFLMLMLRMWTIVKSCAGKTFSLLRCMIFKKQPNIPNTSTDQQAKRRNFHESTHSTPQGADELVSKLLSSRDLNAYQVLGVSSMSTDEEIKRKYRDMAKMVHPDKNTHEDSGEAFQILQTAFEAICDEEKRKAYECANQREKVEEEMEKFFHHFMDKVKNNVMCSACHGFHPRVATNRSVFAARYCAKCNERHPAKEGDVWVETSYFGFKYFCYGLLKLPPNAHRVYVSVTSEQRPPWENIFDDKRTTCNSQNKARNNEKKRRTGKGKSSKNKKRV
ncbi:uncharacterized protein LOC124456198 isoform X2 [Xenia sp. Carnegie-2017]|uniref:uncharacterized protein LOC124456198 isoform X2 n=1 Tax=Xenia sp. Carnegie-2017 TaxID=2897299 RepID=UPI001F048262|nr:uncharacterized protein LOC124456198 isoform X2 [Xenia sp. Carnegie-2017]